MSKSKFLGVALATFMAASLTACGSDSSVSVKSVEYFKQNPSEAMEKFKDCTRKMVELEKSGVKMNHDLEKDLFAPIRQKYGKNMAQECENALKIVETMK